MEYDITLPGSIPNLLRKGSPVRHYLGDHGVVIRRDPRPPESRHGDWEVAPVGEWSDGWEDTVWMAQSCRVDELALDLTDATGRAHAAWYCFEYGPGEWDQRTYLLLYDAACNRDCDTEALRRVVLHVAGRADG